MQQYGELKENVNLKDYNTYKIGGKAKYLIKPYNIEALKDLIRYLKENSIKYFILGKGSNVILPDEDYDGVVILLSKLNHIEIKNNVVYAESGILLNNLINELMNNNLSGLENLYGIPGTLGGAIVQNVEAHKTQISDYLIDIKYLEDDKIKEIRKEDCNFVYRSSIFKKNKSKIILSCTFSLQFKDKSEIKKQIEEIVKKRVATQPLEYPNAGSVFKNPESIPAGKLIEDNNLKGYHINGAYVSNKHANFIVNLDNATSKDIKDLIDYIKIKIKQNTNIDLELEQEIIKY